jgi:hypothetical protein
VIQDEYDPVIDFSWFLFIGKTRLGLSFKETGRLTLTMFNKLYGHYKNTWDLEMRLKRANMTYSEAFIKSQKAEEWF